MSDTLRSQLDLLRVLHSGARPLLASLREKLMAEQLDTENRNQPPSLRVAVALAQIDTWNELAEKVEEEQRAW